MSESELLWDDIQDDIIDLLRKPEIIKSMRLAVMSDRPPAECIQDRLWKQFDGKINRSSCKEMEYIRQQIGDEIGKVMKEQGYSKINFTKVDGKVFSTASRFKKDT